MLENTQQLSKGAVKAENWKKKWFHAQKFKKSYIACANLKLRFQFYRFNLAHSEFIFGAQRKQLFIIRTLCGYSLDFPSAKTRGTRGYHSGFSILKAFGVEA